MSFGLELLSLKLLERSEMRNRCLGRIKSNIISNSKKENLPPGTRKYGYLDQNNDFRFFPICFRESRIVGIWNGKSLKRRTGFPHSQNKIMIHGVDLYL